VFRRGYDVGVEAVEPAEADAIAAFRAGETLGEVSERLAREDTRGVDVVALFQRWVVLGWIAQVRLAGSDQAAQT
jgi:hypothetical protein